MSDITTDPAFLADLQRAQRIGLESCAAAFDALEAGMDHDDVAALLIKEIEARGATTGDPPLVHFGDETAGGILTRTLRASPLGEGEVVCLAVRPIIGQAVGEFGDTRVYGENGRYWQFRRMAYRIFQAFLDSAGTCETERDIIRLADDHAYQRGFSLFHPLAGTIAHPLRPTDARAERMRARKELLTNRLRRLLPGSDRPFEGPWCVEPRFLVADVGYMFKCVIMRGESGGVEVVGGPLPEGVSTGPWLA